MTLKRERGNAEQQNRKALGFGLASAVAAGAGLFLWNRSRGAVPGQESTAEEVEAHPS